MVNILKSAENALETLKEIPFSNSFRVRGLPKSPPVTVLSTFNGHQENSFVSKVEMRGVVNYNTTQRAKLPTKKRRVSQECDFLWL